MIQPTQALGNPRDCCQICSRQRKKPDMECRLSHSSPKLQAWVWPGAQGRGTLLWTEKSSTPKQERKEFPWSARETALKGFIKNTR